jgi:4-amino-4-deoxy-L-arabinose transferase-like glycosyltransferase
MRIMIFLYFKKVTHNKSLLFLGIPLILSSFTHLWNPIGFPAIWVVEGQYMQRAMSVLEGFDLQESKDINPHLYDHPFFGQFFLAGLLAIMGYPDSFSMNNPSSEIEIDNTIKILYSVPRIFMGLLAVLDTYLVYKIAEYRYNKTVAFIAAILFAVMPITWILRKIFLESLLLPLLLLSILFALYSNKDSIHLKSRTVSRNIWRNKIKNHGTLFLVLLSGIFLGLSIFTKVPVFTMIPLVGYLICTYTNTSNGGNKNNNHNIDVKRLGIWFIPVILIPLIWPTYSILVNDFDLWLKDMQWNMQREYDYNDRPVGSSLLNSLEYIFQIDPIIFLLGCASIVFSFIKRDHFVLLWIIPFLIFLFVVDFVSFFHLILLLPIICIAGAGLIVGLSNKVKKIKFQRILPFAIISIIGVFGLGSTAILITSNVNSSYFDVYAFVVQYLSSHNNQLNKNNDHETPEAVDEDKVIMLGRHWTRSYFWIPRYALDINIEFQKIDQAEDIPIPAVNDKTLLIVDNRVRNSLSDRDMSEVQKYYYYYTITPIATFKDKTIKYDTSKYPYASMSENRDINWVHIRGFNLSK